MMEAVKRGGNRQELHEIIRTNSMAATAQMKEGNKCDLLARLAAEPAFGGLPCGRPSPGLCSCRYFTTAAPKRKVAAGRGWEVRRNPPVAFAGKHGIIKYREPPKIPPRRPL